MPFPLEWRSCSDMDDRPFYELDDEELILEEATASALGPIRSFTPKVTSEPLYGASTLLTLRSPLDQPALNQLQALVQQKPNLTILDHARLINACACTIDSVQPDRLGLAMLFHHDSALLQLETIAPKEHPRSIDREALERSIDTLVKGPSDHEQIATAPLSRQLGKNDLLAFSFVQDDQHVFFALRRLGLALLPNVTKHQQTTDSFKDYAFHARIFINALAARWTMLTWRELLTYHADDADHYARALIQTLEYELKGIV